jgi:protein TonB
MDWREGKARRLVRWAAAFLVVGSVHVAGAASSLLWPSAPADEEPDGVFVIELAPMTTSVQAPTHEMAPGQDREDAAEAQPAKPEEKVVEQEDLAPPLPKIAEAPEDLVLPEPTPERKPEEKPKEKEEQRREELAVEASQAAVAARPLQVEDAAAASRTAAPMIGLSARDARTKARWQREVVAHLGRFKRYPAAARDRSETGEIVLKLVLDRSGKVADADVIRSSGSSRLDEAAIEMATRANPLPPPPEQIPGQTIELLVPVRFQLKD